MKTIDRLPTYVKVLIFTALVYTASALLTGCGAGHYAWSKNEHRTKNPGYSPKHRYPYLIADSAQNYYK